MSRRPALHLSCFAGGQTRHGVGIIEGALRHGVGVDPVLVVVEVRGPPVVKDFLFAPLLRVEDCDHRFWGGRQRETAVDDTKIFGRSRTSWRTRRGKGITSGTEYIVEEFYHDGHHGRGLLPLTASKIASRRQIKLCDWHRWGSKCCPRLLATAIFGSPPLK